MDVVMSARELAGWKNKTDYPSATQVNSITQMIRDGKIVHAEKVLGEWQVNCSREWPGTFPPTAERAEYDPKTVIADFLIEVGMWLRDSAKEDDAAQLAATRRPVSTKG